MWIAQRFEDLARILVQDCQANGRRSPERIRGSLRHLRGFFRDHLAVDITSERVTRYITWRQKDGAAPATINRELAALKRAFRLAARAGKVALRPEITLLRENNRRKGFFEPNQYTSLLQHLPDYLKPVIQTAYITVMADPVRDPDATRTPCRSGRGLAPAGAW